MFHHDKLLAVFSFTLTLCSYLSFPLSCFLSSSLSFCLSACLSLLSLYAFMPLCFCEFVCSSVCLSVRRPPPPPPFFLPCPLPPIFSAKLCYSNYCYYHFLLFTPIQLSVPMNFYISFIPSLLFLKETISNPPVILDCTTATQ